MPWTSRLPYPALLRGSRTASVSPRCSACLPGTHGACHGSVDGNHDSPRSPSSRPSICACSSAAARTQHAAPSSPTRRALLVSHSDWSSVTGEQNRTLDALEVALGSHPPSVRWRFARQQHQVGSGASFDNETSRRSRSLLFLALGAAASATAKTELWVAENGFTSLNPPLMAESLGALSTRTTHPAFVTGLSETLTDVGLNIQIRNRFIELTKGEMFSQVVQALGPPRASALLSATHSCGKPQRLADYAPDAPCGLCLGCLVRRGAFIAAGLPDQTEYLEQVLPTARRAKWLTPRRRATYQALQDRLELGFTEDDVLDLGLPDDADLDSALGLLRRGLAELGAVSVP